MFNHFHVNCKYDSYQFILYKFYWQTHRSISVKNENGLLLTLLIKNNNDDNCYHGKLWPDSDNEKNSFYYYVELIQRRMKWNEWHHYDSFACELKDSHLSTESHQMAVQLQGSLNH